jgi:CMP-N,N'-diacetyllegionaminic acid synthase
MRAGFLFVSFYSMLFSTMRVYALIPARGGSKGVPKKNITKLGGYPLIAFAIAAAKLSNKIQRIIVSTDNEEIAEVAAQYGAEVPFLRPTEFSRDDSPDIEFVEHAIKWFEEKELILPELLVHMRATTPLRRPADIDTAVDMLAANPEATSLRSGYEMRESPYKLFGITNGYFTGLFPNDPRSEYWSLPRQAFPPAYQPDGYVDVLKTGYIKKTAKMHGDKILAFVSEDTGEVDTFKDFEYLEHKLQSGSWEVYQWLQTNFPL